MSPIPGDNRQDPHNSNHDDLSLAAMDTNIIIAAGSSSESAEEDEDGGHHGYQMLPQDPMGVESDDSDEEEMDTDALGAVGGGAGRSDAENNDDNSRRTSTDVNSSSSRTPSYMQVPHIDNPEVVERKSLWSQSRLQPQEPMDDDHLNKIKSAMSGFSLPGCQIPTWARVISEDDWKAQLLGRLQGQVPLLSSPSSQNTGDNDSSRTEQEVSDTPPDSSSQSDPPNKRARCSLDGTEIGGEEEKPAEVAEKVAVDENPQENSSEER